MPELFTWVGDHPEPCDVCWKPVRRTDDWVAFRDPYARQGVKFECRDCYQLGLARAEEFRKALRREWETYDAARG